MEPVPANRRSHHIWAGVLILLALLSFVWLLLRDGDAPAEPQSRPAPTTSPDPISAACRSLLERDVSTSPAGDLVLAGGTVVTMDRAGTRADGLAIRDGSIESIPPAGAPSGSSDVVDLQGAAVLPGFIDSHSHWIGDRDLVGQWHSQAIDSALAQGWTSISELFVNEGRLTELCALEAGGDLRLKVGAFLPINYESQRFGRWYEAYEPGQVFGQHLFVQGIKIFADRADDGLGYQTDPPDPSVQGTLFWEPEELAAEIEHAHDAGWQIALHATGDGGLDLALDAFASIDPAGIVEARHRIEHLTVVRDDQIDVIADLGLIASIQHSWFHTGTVSNLTRWLGDRVDLTGRWRDFLDAGIPLAGGTDRPWAIAGETGDSLSAIGQAVTRVGPDGDRPPRWMLRQRLTVEEVLRSITIDAAFAQGTEDSVGSIEVGKAADLVILSADPTRVEPEAITDIKVLATIVNGRVEFCAPATPPDLRPHCPER